MSYLLQTAKVPSSFPVLFSSLEMITMMKLVCMLHMPSFILLVHTYVPVNNTWYCSVFQVFIQAVSYCINYFFLEAFFIMSFNSLHEKQCDEHIHSLNWHGSQSSVPLDFLETSFRLVCLSSFFDACINYFVTVSSPL